jgi:hypothetical protein
MANSIDLQRKLQRQLQYQNRQWALTNPDFLAKLYSRIVAGLDPDLRCLVSGSEASPLLDDGDLLVVISLAEPHIATHANRHKFAAIAEPLAVALGIERLGICCGYDHWAAIAIPGDNSRAWVVVDESEYFDLAVPHD